MTVYLFWTGGFDSTFRLCQLLFEKGEEVQPIYVSDRSMDNVQGAKWKRQSWKYERHAIHQLIKLFEKETLPKGALLLEPIEFTKIPTSPRVDQCMADLAGRGLMIRSKRQHGTLAEVTRHLKKPIEICIVKGEHFGRVLPEGAFTLDVKGRPCLTRSIRRRIPSLRIFSRLRFPLINLTKKEILEKAKEGGYLHILEHTWSCWFPKDNLPCGRCAMCRRRPNFVAKR